jgi:cobyric acid synthase
MTPFFIDEEIFHDIEDFLHDRQLENKEEIDALPDNWEQKIEYTQLEKIFEIDDNFIDDICEWLCEKNEERIPEFFDTTEAKIKKALRESIDIKKLKELMPELWYPNDEEGKLTKKDLLDAL